MEILCYNIDKEDTVNTHSGTSSGRLIVSFILKPLVVRYRWFFHFNYFLS